MYSDIFDTDESSKEGSSEDHQDYLASSFF